MNILFILLITCISCLGAAQQMLTQATANSGLGDTPYSTVIKVNTNFSDLFLFRTNILNGSFYSTNSVASNLLTKLNIPISVKTFGAVGDGVTDDTAAFRLASASTTNGTILIPKGTYLISGSITNNPGQKWIGETINSTVITNSSTNFAFRYDGIAYGTAVGGLYNLGLVFSDFMLYSENGIKIGSPEVSTNTGEGIIYQYDAVTGVVIDRVHFWGNYTKVTADATAALPTLAQLESVGIGLKLYKCFNASIRDSRIERYGCGIYLNGCDISQVDNNMLWLNTRHIWVQCSGYYGSGVKVINNNIVNSFRPGGIYVDGITWDARKWFILGTIIQNNFIEETFSGLYAPMIETQNDSFTSIKGNRFNTTSETVKIKTSPYQCVNISENYFGDYATAPYILPYTTNYNVSANLFDRVLGTVRDNNPSTIFEHPFFITESYKDNELSAYSHKRLIPNINYTSFPWEVDTTTNSMAQVLTNWSLKLKASGTYVYFQRAAIKEGKNLTVGLRGRLDAAAGATYGYVSVELGIGSGVYADPITDNFVGLTNKVEHEWRYKTFLIPRNLNPNNISVFVDTDNIHVSGLTINMEKDIIANSAPTNIYCPQIKGTKIKRMTPALGEWSELINIEDGVYGVTNGVWVTNSISGI